MDSTLIKKIKIWIISSGNLLIAFLIGLFIPIGALLIPLLVIFDYYILQFLMHEIGLTIPKKKISIWVMLTVNLLFAFVIGLTIPLLESASRYNMGLVMIPLLIILNYILIDRFHFYLKRAKNGEEPSTEINKGQKTNDKPIIEYEKKKYIFSINSIILLAIGAPILAYAIYYFFDNEMNFWLHEIVVKHTVFILQSLLGLDVKAVYSPQGRYHWGFRVSERGVIGFETFCTGIQAICVFAGIIICTPHSQDPKTRSDIIWRKTKSLILSSSIFYIVNILRMVIQIYLYYIGYAWSDIHYSISAASSFIAAIIILLLHKWIPEFIISIIYTGTLVAKKLKKKEKVDDNEENSSKSDNMKEAINNNEI
ncbi:MAG: archaeosortase H [Promethearchaeota archaeon]